MFQVEIFKEALVSRHSMIFVDRSSEILFSSTNINPKSFLLSRTWYVFVRDTCIYWKALWARILHKISHENKPEQSKPFSVLASSAPSSAVSFSLLISFTISGLLELGRYATYNQQTSFLNETSCRTYIFWKEKGASLFTFSW